MSTRLLSLCSGIGMIDYVWSIILGQEIAGQVEINPYCQLLLSERWPTVPKVRDIKELTNDDPFGPVDVVAGGIPCQPFSNSGKRRGTDDDRHLWPSAFAIVQRRRPTWVFIENVAGFVSLALDLVQADLESAGYQSRAYVLPACALGAPHIRERVFILAHTDGNRQWHWTNQSQYSQCKGTAIACTDGTQRTLAPGNCQRHGEYIPSPGNGLPQSGMGRELDGFADWVDRTQWPALPREPQHAWEPPRTVTRKFPQHDARLEALGNTIVPYQIYPFLKFIVEYERGGL